MATAISSTIHVSGGSSFNLLVPSEVKEPRIIDLQEVSWHDTAHDCWVIIYDRVYDITTFFDEHPGGQDLLLEHAGRDASIAFRGSGHSAHAVRMLQKYYIGELPMEERIFRTPTGIKLSGLPV